MTLILGRQDVEDLLIMELTLEAVATARKAYELAREAGVGVELSITP
jgi:hypothetical protein